MRVVVQVVEGIECASRGSVRVEGVAGDSVAGEGVTGDGVVEQPAKDRRRATQEVPGERPRTEGVWFEDRPTLPRHRDSGGETERQRVSERQRWRERHTVGW